MDDGSRLPEPPETGTGRADLEALTLLAALILGQEQGISDGSLVAAGGCVWPNAQAGTVPSFDQILAGLREERRRDGFWDDSAILGCE